MTYTREQVEQAGEDWLWEQVADVKRWEFFHPTIGAAWELVGEMESAARGEYEHVEVTLHQFDKDFHRHPALRKRYWVFQVRAFDCNAAGIPWFDRARGTAPTAPLAICKAYLLWRLENQPSVQGEVGNVGEESN